ncbi:sulfatase-like hydrolase/transferase [Rhizobium sp. AQ_MP]|uniref:sulfatase-like hydrolase/transferase n=1 Tax=Rhizobium sp. AQ_MP TaxID=2761536 RepID=UPI00163AA4D7|nr:sulfatase-like hydrolase/transferase [Rhizobium sp. AQ_MP]MBC2773617.1 sulfatase-like hydrolase/transferase [Rhizobium sp. AQ_MP]
MVIWLQTQKAFKGGAAGSIVWAAVFAWAVLSIVDTSITLMPSERALLFSCILLFLYVFLKIRPGAKDVRLVLTYAATLLFAAWHVLYSLFGAVDIDAILFHLNYDVGSAAVQGQAIRQSLIALIPFFLVMISWWQLAGKSRGMALLNRCLPAALLALNPLSWLFAAGTLASAASTPDDLSNYFVDPRASVVPAGPTKNLVHIFVESAELTLWDEKRFGTVAGPLKELATRGWIATNIEQVNLTGWTLAGQVASTCGVPLMPLGIINRNSFDLVDEVLPGAECLGDILDRHGYTNVFLKGASLDFAGTHAFAAGHGYDRLLGYDELHHRFPGRSNYWGLHDEDMLQVAYELAEELSEDQAPFSLTLTTVGGHAPTGFVSPSCETLPLVAQQPSSTLKAFACTNWLVKRFVDRLENSGLLQNTILIVQSDHLSMRNEVYADLNASVRRNMFMVLGGGHRGVVDKPASSIDLFPTILAALGFSSLDGRAGLGVDLQHTSGTLVERLGTEGLNRAISRSDKLRDRVWQLDRQLH